MFIQSHNNREVSLVSRQNPALLKTKQHVETGKHLPRFRAIPCIVKICCFLLFFTFLSTPASVQAARHKEFPEYPSIRDNVEFWEKIYSIYSINTAVIHDQDDLSKIYAVITLKDKNLPQANKENINRIKTAKKKYSQILKKLSTGSPPATKEEIRIAAMFTGPSARRAMRQAAENIRYQNGLKERFYEGAIRSVAYIRKIRQILIAHGLPGDLAYLPHVESSFNPQAHSKSGAAGIWQFTRSTGRQYMKINRHIDQRRDPFISTKAAAKLLKKNYEALGSWPLAITAYNYGTAGMMRAVQAYGGYEAIFKKYRKGYFKFASRNFYSEFLAAKKVAKRLLGNQPRRRKIAHGSPLIKVKATRVKRIVSHPATPVQHLRPKSHRRFYIVKRGDTASSIAAAHNISVNKLCSENKLGPKAVIRIGQNLKIPVRTAGNDEKTNPRSSADDDKRSAMLQYSVPQPDIFRPMPYLQT